MVTKGRLKEEKWLTKSLPKILHHYKYPALCPHMECITNKKTDRQNEFSGPSLCMGLGNENTKGYLQN